MAGMERSWCDEAISRFDGCSLSVKAPLLCNGDSQANCDWHLPPLQVAFRFKP